mgnify:CR=1 FL=1
MKYNITPLKINFYGRSPHGERGLKSREIDHLIRSTSRSPHGERGLKSFKYGGIVDEISRSPHGERGLKSDVYTGTGGVTLSLSSRRAWIEI